MTRAECEKLLLTLTEQALEILHMYDPEAKWLSLTENDGHINISAMKRDTEVGKGLMEDSFAVHVTKFKDGDIWGTEEWAEVVRNACERAS